MRTAVLFLGVAIMMLDASAASAQRTHRRYQIYDHKVDVNVYGGYMWTNSRSFSIDNVRGDLDVRSNPYWGLELDINIRDGMQIALLYNRLDSELTFKRDGTAVDEPITDITLEYLHAGVVAGVPRGNTMPFTTFSLGATHLNPKDPVFEDNWKFSMILGLGVKHYLSERFGLRIHGRIPYTFTSGGGTLFCDSDGRCYQAIGGTGIPQADLGAGLIVMF